MTTTELFADVLSRNLEFVKMTLADFTDAELFTRPAPTANHAAWQLGHLITAETMMINGIKPGSMPELPAGFADKFSLENSKIDDPKFFNNVTKAQLFSMFEKTRGGTVNWVRSLTPADMDKATDERMRQWVPTVGHLAVMLPVHVAMHVGQFQVIRRKLGKPVLF